MTESKHLILFGTHDRFIRGLIFDENTNTLSLSTKFEITSHVADPPAGVSWVVRHPKHHDIIYCNSWAEGRVFVLRVLDAEGNLKILDEGKSGGIGTTHLAVFSDGSAIVMANYMSGSVSLLPLLPSGLLQSKTPDNDWIFTLPRGPSLAHFRQEAPHAHQIVIHGDKVFVPDLGSNKLWWLKWDTTVSKWILISEIIDFEDGDGPRHCVVHPSGSHVYCLNELSSTLTVHTIPQDPAAHKSQLVKRFSILPPSDENQAGREAMTAAEVILLPSQTPTGPMLLLATNRDTPRNEGDAIAKFAVSVTDGGKIERTANGWSGPVTKHLRAMESDDEHKFIVLAGREGGEVVMLKRCGDGGLELQEVARLPAPYNLVVPIWVEIK